MEHAEFQRIADNLTNALISGDFAGYSALMLLPLKITPRNSEPYLLRSEDELRSDFDLYHQIIRLNGVTDIFRDVQDVQPLRPNEALVQVMTHIMQRAHRIVAPFRSQFHLRHVAGDWRIVEIESSEGHINWTLGRNGLTPFGHFEGDGNDDAET